MSYFSPGDRIIYTGSMWPPGTIGTVLYSRGEDAYRVKLDEPYNTFEELTMLTKNMSKVLKASPRVETVRARVLNEAKRITATDRNSSYGEPEDNFQRIADFWNVWLQGRLKDGTEITAGDTAAMQIMVKVAREMNAPKEDNKVDIAGYAACWAEVDA
jgi:hypothetical protein